MKLGTETGSLTNHVLSRAVIGQPTPVVGMGATLLSWTDRHGATIVSVTPYRGTVILGVQRDKAKRTDKNGMSESQTWVFEPDPTAPTLLFRREPGGQWVEVGYSEKTKRYKKLGGYGLRIGERSEYYDFSF